MTNRGNDSALLQKINDKWLFRYVYPVLAVLIVHIGNENSFNSLIRNPTYYTDILLALFCIYICGVYFRKIHARIDQVSQTRRKSRQIYKRIIILGIILPTGAVLIIEVIYLILIGVPLKESAILYLELPIVILYCMLLNLTYLYLYNTQQNKALVENFKQLASQSQENSVKEFVVHFGSKQKLISVSEVAYFLVENKLTFLVTKDDHKFLYDRPLREVREMLSTEDFFSLNRQIIAHRGSILDYQKTDTRRLQVTLSPAMEAQVFVAKSNAKDFDDWLRLKK